MLRSSKLLLATLPATLPLSLYTYEELHLLSSPPPPLPLAYNEKLIAEHFKHSPFTVFKRLATIGVSLTPFVFKAVSSLRYSSSSSPSSSPSSQPIPLPPPTTDDARNLKLTLQSLGPLFIKFGQQLSIRPDLIPQAYITELRELCDSCSDFFADADALMLIKDELKVPSVEHLYADKGGPFLERLVRVSTASLGQVYKTSMINPNDPKKAQVVTVAVKVQKPNVREQVALDLMCLRNLFELIDTLSSLSTKQEKFHAMLFREFAGGTWKETDYVNEGRNTSEFRRLLITERRLDTSYFGSSLLNKLTFGLLGTNTAAAASSSSSSLKIVIPEYYPQTSSTLVITTSWIDGPKLSDAPKDVIQRLVPVGVETFLIQLLEIGVFHADPHPGNLIVARDEYGRECLGLIDFGLVAEVGKDEREALTEAIYHLLVGDYKNLINVDSKRLGFLTGDQNTDDLEPLLIKVLGTVKDSGSNLKTRRKKLKTISSELNTIFFDYAFNVPPFFALVTRGLGLLEGIAVAGDEDFDIFEAAGPYARKRAFERGVEKIQRRVTGQNKKQVGFWMGP